MSCDEGEATKAYSPNFLSLHLRHSSFCNPFIALPTSQLILQPFHCFTYVTDHSPTLLSLLLRHRFFTYVTWLAVHANTTFLPFFIVTSSRISHCQFLLLHMLIPECLLFPLYNLISNAQTRLSSVSHVAYSPKTIRLPFGIKLLQPSTVCR